MALSKTIAGSFKTSFRNLTNLLSIIRQLESDIWEKTRPICPAFSHHTHTALLKQEIPSACWTSLPQTRIKSWGIEMVHAHWRRGKARCSAGIRCMRASQGGTHRLCPVYPGRHFEAFCHVSRGTRRWPHCAAKLVICKLFCQLIVLENQKSEHTFLRAHVFATFHL